MKNKKEDPSAKSKKQKEEEERNMKKPTHIVRVLEVKFFANNTFATIGKLDVSFSASATRAKLVTMSFCLR